LVVRGPIGRAVRGPRIAAGVVVAILLLQCGPSLAQSGRARERKGRPVPTPSTQPQPSPGKTPAAPVPGPAAAPLASGAKIVDQDTEGTTSRFVFRNGMTLVVDETHTVPLAAVHAYVRTGDEPAARPGLAGLAGRMLLEGSQSRPEGAGAIRALGGTVGADVTAGATELWAAVPARELEPALEIHRDLLVAPAFETGAVARVVRGAVDERALHRLEPDVAAIESLRALVVAGDSSRSATTPTADATLRDELVAFHGERYRPDRIVLAVSGDVVTFDVLAAVQRLYGAVGGDPTSGVESEPASSPAARRPPGAAKQAQPRPVPAPKQAEKPPVAPPVAPQAPEPAKAGARFASARFDGGRAVLGVGYEAPALSADDAPAAEVLASALGGGRMSRLGRALRTVAGVQGVTALYEGLPSSGFLGVVMNVDPSGVEVAEAAYFREVDRFRRELMSEGELQRARNLCERRFLDAVERPEGVARRLARFEAQAKNFRAAATYVQRTKKVTAADVQRLAARMLSTARANVSEHLPPSAPARTVTAEQFGAIVLGWAPDGARDVAPADVKAAAEIAVVPEAPERRRQGEVGGTVLTPMPLPVRDFSTFRGPKAFVREDQSRPEVSIGFFFGGGRMTESEAESGITELMLRSILRGTKDRPGDALLLTLEQLGGEVRVVNEADFFGLVVDVLSRNADAAAALVVNALEKPAFEQAEILRERAALLSDQLAARGDGVVRSFELMWHARAPRHAYGRPELGAPESVAKLTDEKVRAWYAATIGVQYPVVGIVGDTDGSSLVSRHVADGFERSDVIETLSVPTLPPAPGTADDVERRDVPATAQALACALPADGLGTPEAFDIVGECVAEGVRRALSGKAGVPCRVAVFADRRRLESVGVAQLLTPAGAEDAGREAVLAEFVRVAGAPVESLQVGRSVAATAHRVRLLDHTARLLEYVRAVYSGAGIGAVEGYPERVTAVTPDAIRKAASSFVPARSWRGVVRGRQ
jgi:zinc protease